MQLVETGRVSEDAVTGSHQNTLKIPEANGGRDALMLVDETGSVVHVNEAWLLVSGRTADEIVGKPASEGPAARDCEALDLLRRSLNDGKSRTAMVYMRHRRGFQLKLHARVMPVSNGTDGVSGFVISLRPMID